MVTIKEVAKLAGVAVSTASNALNDKYGVKPETKKRVLEAAKELNYIPNPYAQGLVTNNKRIISMVISGPSSLNFFTNPAFEEIIKSVTQTLNQNGYQAILNIITREEEEEAIPRIAKSRLADALILMTTRTPDRELETILENVDLPTIVLIRSAPNESVLTVSIDNQKCGYMATKFLIDNGHRRIAFLGDLPGVSIAQERLDGYKKALKEAEIDYDQTLVVNGDYYQESGAVGARQLLRQCSSKPTAIFTGNDLMALGVMEAFEQEGISIPNDISLIGIDNIPNLHLLKVPLTTISSPYLVLGRTAANKVIGILNGMDNIPNQTILQSEIRVRMSVKSI